MGDTFEKRRREQKKRQKKKEKALMKSEREADKARGGSPGFKVASLEDIVGDLAFPEVDETEKDAEDGGESAGDKSAGDAENERGPER